MARGWPLIGRREELDFVVQALSGRRHGVILSGTAGVGKTRLAQEALQAVQDRGMVVHWTVATKGAATIPFGAFAHLLPSNIEGSNLAVILRQMLDVLVDMSSGKTLVLGVDDAHLLDGASAAFLHQVALTGKALVVATVRAGEPSVDSVVSLWKDGLVERLELQPLSQSEVEQLAFEALGGSIDTASQIRLWESSRGNPLVLRELILQGIETGALVELDSVWRWTGAVQASPRLQEVLESRLGSIDSDELRILYLLAIGEPLGSRLLEEFADQSLLESLEQRGLVEINVDDRRTRLCTAHPLYSEILRSRISAGRRRLLTRQLADAQQGQGLRRRDDVLRVATWRLEAGGDIDSSQLIAAAGQAHAAFDYSLAERLSRAAVLGGAGFEAEIILADSLRSQGTWKEAEELLSRLEKKARNGQELAETSIIRAYNLFFGKDSASEAKSVLISAEANIHDRKSRMSLMAQRALLSLYSGDPTGAHRTAVQVLAAKDASPTVIVEAAMASAAGLAIKGKPLSALEECNRVEKTLGELGPDGALLTGQFLAVRWLALWLAGHLEQAETLADSAYKLAYGHGSHDGMALMSAAAGQSAFARGLVKRAKLRLSESVALFRKRDRNRFLAWTLGSLGQAAVFAGDIDAAAAAVSEAEAVSPKASQLFSSEFERGRAWLAFARGERTRGAEIAIAAAQDADRTGSISFQIRLLHDAARMGQSKRVARRMEHIATKMEGELGVTYAENARGLAENDPKVLQQTASKFEAMGAWLLAAEAAAAAATAFQEAGKMGTAAAMRSQATDLIGLCEGVDSSTISLHFEDSELTAREHEVISLVVRGMTSKEIAEKLVLSVRTVDNHLHRAYSKLGVSSRKELLTIER